MKKLFFIITILLCTLPVAARHVAGGELFYEFLGSTGGNSNYRITLRLFRDCTSTGPLLENEKVNVGIYENGVLFGAPLPLPMQGSISTITMNTSVFPCLVGNVSVCYEMAIYSNTVTLPDNQPGYTLSRTGCCRVDRISNLSVQTNVGSNYVTYIPGLAALLSGHNSSPQFLVKDTTLVCANKQFVLDFGAVDPDYDSLTYSFCDAYTSANASNNAPPANSLGLTPLPYEAPFSGTYPLGAGVTINNKTGIISGIAPAQGQYVVNVCISEWRGGQLFTRHQKDFILKVQNCDFVEAVLPKKIISCNKYTVHFENQSTSSAITSYLWNFGNPSAAVNSSTSPTVDYTYSDTGRFVARLTVTGPKGCVGSDSGLVLVYPGFVPAFNITGSCFVNPYIFKDTTTTNNYGVVDSWHWNFGEEGNSADTSNRKTAQYRYGQPGTHTVSLVVTSSKGCIDSLHKDLVVLNKPIVHLPFRDTLICSIDTLPILVPGTGSFSWLPNTNILFGNTAHPLVFPKDTTRYMVIVNENGCINTDTVTVNVLNFITVQLRPDTTICKTDSITIRPVSQALSYRWAPVYALNDPLVKNPVATPLINTNYQVTANLGKCQATANINVRVVPYPQVRIATPDTTICFGDRIQLHGITTGTSFQWSPVSTLSNSNTLTPIAGPGRSTNYMLTASDTLGGCPKAISDTVTITVAPPVIVDAGRDTSIVANQLLQLNAVARGATRFLWKPPTGLSDATIANPVVQLGIDVDSISYRVRASNANGCYGEDDITVHVYKSAPEIFVPSAFTPNNDGRNDILKPITAGISQLYYFKVFNRWGQLLFQTTEMGKGWDGTYNGLKQPSNTYVYATEGIDYTGKIVFRKGTCVLIR